MFTGIVEQTALVVRAERTETLLQLTVGVSWPDVRHGQSIALNGACLTVVESDLKSVRFDVIQETLDKTNLGSLRVGHRVNLERALRVGDRFDGHFVQGHVDETGTLVDKQVDSSQWRFRIQTSRSFGEYLTPKGSITLDGVSLTLAACGSDWFEVALIPTTLELTTLADKNVGDRLNLEGDMLVKTVVRYLNARKT